MNDHPSPDDHLRERLIQGGVEALTSAELLAVLLRTGKGGQSAFDLATELLAEAGSLRELAQLNYADLAQLPGITPAKVAQILAALELGKRSVNPTEDERAKIRTAEDAARLVGREMEALKQEHFRTILLDVHRRVISVPTVYIGSLNMTIIRPAEVFREAITRNCASMILCHNHPSGDPTPSPTDLTITEDLIAAGRLLDIAILDHVIIGQGRWVSLRDTGVKF